MLYFSLRICYNFIKDFKKGDKSMWEEMSYNKYKSSNRLKDEYEPEIDEDDIDSQTLTSLLNIELETEEE